MRHRPLRHLALTTVLAAVAALGAAAPAQAAPGITGTRVLPELSLQAGGAGVAARVQTTCPSGFTAVISVEVRQQASGQTHSASGSSRSFLCDGTARRLPVGVPSQGPPWRLGGAFVRITVFACSVDGCLNGVGQGSGTVTRTALSAPTQSAGTLAAGLSGMTLSLPATGTLERDGATVSVTARYRCTSWSGTNLVLAQRDADGVVRTSGEFQTPTCDGTWRSAPFALTRDGQHRGPAFVMADSIACNIFCGLPSVRPFRTITVV